MKSIFRTKDILDMEKELCRDFENAMGSLDFVAGVHKLLLEERFEFGVCILFDTPEKANIFLSCDKEEYPFNLLGAGKEVYVKVKFELSQYDNILYLFVSLMEDYFSQFKNRG